VSATLGLPRETVTESASAMTRRLYESYGQRVLTFCLSRLRDREEAQDAAQTTFVYVLRALERGVVPRHELAWLLKIAENVCHSSRRSLGRRMAVTSSADVTELEAAADSFSPESSEQVRDLREALELLPDNQRRAVLLREWQGLSYAEIADELHLSVPAVEALLFRARRALAAHLQRTRSRLLNVGSSLAALRSLVQGGPAKMAVATAVAGIASAPAIVDEHRDAVGKGRRAPAGANLVAAPRPATSAPRTARTAPRPVGAHLRSTSAAEKSRSAREAAVRAAAPTVEPTPAESSAPAPGVTPEAPAPAPAPTPDPTLPAPPAASMPPGVQPVVEQATSAVPAVVGTVGTVAGTVIVPAPPPVPPIR
jgi:RNA polymerase sigma factor (sigma-70 family)